MNVLVLVTDAFGGRGGIAKFNRDLLTALSADPACDSVIAIPRTIAEPIGAIPAKVDFRSVAAGGKIAFVRETMAALRDHRFDAVVCGHVHLSALAAYAAWRSGAPWLLVTHGIEAWQPPHNRSARFFARRAERVVAVSDLTRARFSGWSAMRTEETSVIPNCVDATLFAPGPKRGDLLSRYALEGKLVLMTLARYSAAERYKGVDEVLRVLPAVANAIPSVAYVVAGDGDDRPRLETLARELGVADRVRFIGYVPEAEKTDHLRLADVFVMPGRGEGFGIAYLEAMACGVPVVASTLDASGETIRGTACGVATNPDDARGLRDAIVRVATQAERPTQADLAHFSVSAFQSRWRQALSELVALPSGARSMHAVSAQ
ncbi:MAG: glycosyltransferase family 1 protein [Gemmatimonadetes bacterium]|nr:glycosyltransferase family 1 protein [Gemmatimonadota bacterium]